MDQLENLSSEAEARERAQKRAKDLREFYEHFAVYVFVNIIIFLVDLFTGGGWWFYWTAVFWGLGLAIHAATVFARFGPFQSGWEERKAEEIFRRERDRR